jgi:DNA-binding transcriptional LysR family regulator
MQSIDLNLLSALHALLSEQSVTRAAGRLHLSVPATSRSLMRCRRTFGDPLLVRSGRGVVITPRGAQLLAELTPLIEQIDAFLEPVDVFDPSVLRRTFVIRTNEAVITAIGSVLIGIVGADAPDVELRFELESAEDLDALRHGDTALAIGSYSDDTNDLEIEHLVTESLVGVVRAGHPVLARNITVARFAALDHVVTSRRGVARGPIDSFLADHGRERRIAAVVPSFAVALAMCVQSDLTTIAPRRLATLLAAPTGLVMFESPVPLPTVDVAMLWHARFDNDPAHQWLRSCVRRVGAPAGPQDAP